VLGTLDQQRSEGIALDVTEYDAKMFIFSDCECFETTLPDVTRAVIMSKIAGGTRGQQPMHPAAQVAIVDRPESQVEVIRHDTIGEQPDRAPQPRFSDPGEKGLLVFRFANDGGAAVATFQDMIAATPDRGARRPRHDRWVLKSGCR
jgi:hypothetical protein